MKISVLCPAEIAYRRFMPALLKAKDFKFAGIGYHSLDEILDCTASDKNAKILNSKNKALKFITEYGGKLYDSYNSVIYDKEVDCIYIPLPPKLHFEYAKKSLLNRKNIIIEKPATVSYEEMEGLIEIAKHNNKVIHENYMFVYHSQLSKILQIIKSGEIGDVRLYRVAYGFPFRGNNDFRYDKELGGGALLDAGVYTIKLATILLGDDCYVDSASVNYLNDFLVDMYGEGVLINDAGTCVQIAFGMDNEYKCELEVWGSKGTISTNRILTAPAGYTPVVKIRKNGVENTVELEEDDSFYNSLLYFKECIYNNDLRIKHYKELLIQSRLYKEFCKKAGIYDKECCTRCE